MSATTGIEWTDATFNPWIGCTKVSPGCKNCYAERTGARLNVVWGDGASRRIASDGYWREPLRWNRAAAKSGVRRRVFCASLADVFEDRADLNAPRARLWRLIEATPHLDWLLLTKRPENADKLAAGASADCFGDGEDMPPVWPRNVWLGTTVEDQEHANERIPHLLRTPAAVRFLSCEPLLGPVDLRQLNDGSWFDREGAQCYDALTGHAYYRDGEHGLSGGPRVDWVIVGGESGHKARSMDLAWPRALVEQCRSAGVPVFVKQMGARPYERMESIEPGHAGHVLEQIGKPLREHRLIPGWTKVQTDDETVYMRYPRFKSTKGGDPAEWPEDLRVREMPAVRS